MAAPFYGNVLTAIDKVLREHGYHTLVSCYSANHGLERDKLHFLISNGIDGLIYAPEDITAEEFYELTANCNIPVVQIDRMIQGVSSDAILVDNADAMYKAVSQMIEKGHRRIGLISGPKSVFTAKERQIGYMRALSDHGIIYDDQLVISGRNDFATGYRGCETLLGLSDPPTAVFTTNYDITIGLVTAARERGIRIPEDMDIFGFDCVDICAMMKPPLPVVHQPEIEIGQTAANYLIQRLRGYNGKPRITRLKCIIEPE
jgi:LacI family transcriptional regulator